MPLCAGFEMKVGALTEVLNCMPMVSGAEQPSLYHVKESTELQPPVKTKSALCCAVKLVSVGKIAFMFTDAVFGTPSFVYVKVAEIAPTSVDRNVTDDALVGEI